MKNILLILQAILVSIIGEVPAKQFMNAMFGKPTGWTGEVLGSICDTLDCDGGICDIDIPECGDIDFGQKIVKVFIALPEADDFNDVTDLTTEGSWQAKLALPCTGATAVNRIVEVGLVHTGLKPPTEDETEEGAYGGDELVSRKHLITFEIKRWNLELFASINEARCRETIKLWYLTNTNYLFGGITGVENVSVNWGSLQFNGIGNGKSKSDNTMSWFAKDDSIPVSTPFLANLTNP